MQEDKTANSDKLTKMFDSNGQSIGALGMLTDITERLRAEERLKTALAEKEGLVKEVHHRVKNNLIVLSYLINMQAKMVEDPVALGLLEDIQGRVKAMGLIHEKLYQAETLGQISLAEYLEDLTADLVHALRGKRPISLRVEAEAVFINVNVAIPCGLIVNELVTNALKYTFPEELTGFSKPVRSEYKIRMDFRLGEGEYVLTVSDNGVGLPPDLDWRAAKSLGLKLVNGWATYQLRGSLEVKTQPEQGTAFKITFAERN